MAAGKFVGLLSLAAALSIGSAAAEEETLKFRLITTGGDETTVEAPNMEGRSLSSGQYRGVAVFEDGRIAFKEWVGASDSGGAEGSFFGYSTYTFQNGDSLILKYTGGWGADGLVGEYEVLSGTGAYEGATGTGRFTAAEEPWDNANLLEVTINVTTPAGS